MKLRWALFIILAIHTTIAHADRRTYTLITRKINIDVPADWKAHTGLLGLPLALLSSMQKDKTRAVISFTPAGKEDVVFGASFVASAQKEFERSKRQWLKENRGTLVDFQPMQDLRWEGIERALVLSFRYDIKDRRNTEKTYYILCGKKLIHVKSMLSAANDGLASQVESIIKGLQCQ